MDHLLNKYGKWAIITGASSGLGEEFCRQLANLNFNLIMIARRKERLKLLKSELLAKYSIEILIIESDLTQPNFIELIKEATLGLDIGLLINNAGFAITGNFLENNINDELKMLDIHCRAPLILSHHFGQLMLKRKHSGIINVSSVTGFIAMPSRVNYSAAKAFSLYSSEGLWFELKANGIDVLTLAPGAIKTEFGSIAGTRNSGMDTIKVAKIGLNNLGKKSLVIPGFTNKIVVIVTRFIPRQLLIKIGAVIIKNIRINT